MHPRTVPAFTRTVTAVARLCDDGSIDRLAKQLADAAPGLSAQPLAGARGGGSHGDPTGDAATSPPAQLPGAAAIRALEQVTFWGAVLLREVAAWGPSPEARGVLHDGPCLCGSLHRPSPSGTKCEECSRAWPCDPDKLEPWLEECDGRVRIETSSCARCERSGELMTCRRCGQDRPRADARRGICGSCRKRDQRVRPAPDGL